MAQITNLRGVIIQRLCIATAVAMVLLPDTCAAQKTTYAGFQGGISTLSADGRTTVAAQTVATSSYKPENGPAIDVFGGLHWNDFLSFQADYVWDRNALTLDASRASANAGAFYEREYRSSQHAVMGNALFYFRARSSRVRPFLAAGTGVVHLAADPRGLGAAQGITPPGAFRSAMVVLQVGVGIDLKVRRGWAFRYSFAETVSSNPISRELDPPAHRNLANFRNLFGIVKEF